MSGGSRLAPACFVSVGSKYEEADHSAEFVSEIFPELQESADIFFMTVSKKALRRFPATDPTPRPLGHTLQASRLLDDRVRRAVAEVADVAVRKVPSLAVHLDHGMQSRRAVADRHGRFLKCVMTARAITSEIAARSLIIHQMLLKDSRYHHPLSAAKAANVSEVARVPTNGSRLIGKRYPGTNFWDSAVTESNNTQVTFPDLAVLQRRLAN